MLQLNDITFSGVTLQRSRRDDVRDLQTILAQARWGRALQCTRGSGGRRAVGTARSVHSLFISTHSPARRTSRMRTEHLKTRKVKIAHHDSARCRAPFASVFDEPLIGSERTGIGGRRAVRRRMADARSATVHFGTAVLLRHTPAVSPGRGARSWRL